MSSSGTNVHLPFAEQNKAGGAAESPVAPQGVGTAPTPTADVVPVVRPDRPDRPAADRKTVDSAAVGDWSEPDLPGVDDIEDTAAAPVVPDVKTAPVAHADDDRPTIEQPVVTEGQVDEKSKAAAPPPPAAPPPAAVPMPSGMHAKVEAPAAAPQVPPSAQYSQQPQNAQFLPQGQVSAAQFHGRPPVPAVFTQGVPGQGAPGHPQAQQMPMRPMGESVSAPMSTATSSFQQHIRLTDSSVRVTGWRAWLRRMGLDVSPSASDQERAELVHRIRVPKNKFHVTSVFADSAGGTLLVGVLGQILERTRADNVVALDLDPDGGDLDQVTAWHQGGSTARTLIQQSDLSDRNQVDKHLAVTPTNLHVLPTPWRFNGRDVTDYDDVLDLYSIFRPHYSLALADAGRGLQTPTGNGVLEISSALILPASATTRGVRKVASTIDWLRHHGWHGLLANTIVVINHTKKRGSVTVEQFDELFRAGQKLRVHEIPYDPHLDSDSPIDLDLLKPRTVRAFELLAADLADSFNSGYEPPAATKLAELQVRSHEGR